MSALKIIAILLLVYAGIVVAFESALGYFQPQAGSTLVITTTDAQGTAKARVVSRLESGGKLYVAANHWPRRWYYEVLAHPDVRVTIAGKTQRCTAVPVTGAELERVEREHRLRMFVRILTGFPPRRLVRLDPV